MFSLEMSQFPTCALQADAPVIDCVIRHLASLTHCCRARDATLCGGTTDAQIPVAKIVGHGITLGGNTDGAIDM